MVAMLAFAACWGCAPTSDTTSSETLNPELTPVARPRDPLPRHYGASGAIDLAHDLRASARSLLDVAVRGPVVELDISAGTVSTLCGAELAENIQAGVALLADPTRNEPTCASLSDSELSCEQLDNSRSGN